MSCNNDKEEVLSNAHSKVTVSKIKFEEIKNKDIVTSKLNKLSTLKDSFSGEGKTNESLLDFTIITEQLKYLEHGDYHTYTFAIYRETPLENIQENLLLELQLDGTYQAYLVRYLITEEEFENIETEISTFEGITVEYIPLEYEDILSKSGCYMTYDTVYVQIPLEGCDCWFVYTYMDNISFSGGCYDPGDFGGGSGGGPGGGPGGGGAPPPPFGSGSTSPLPKGQITDINGNTFNADILKLNSLTANTTIKSRINQMKSVINTSSTELGSEFRTTSVFNQYSEYQLAGNDLGFDYSRFPDAISSSKVRLHMHHNTTNSEGGKIQTVFSAEDIFGMANFYNQKEELEAADSKEITSILLSRSGLYALRISDEDKLNQFYNDLNTIITVGNDVMKYSDFLIDRYNIDVIQRTIDSCDNCPDEHEAALFELYFKKFLNKLDCGLGLYNSIADSDGNYTWTSIN